MISANRYAWKTCKVLKHCDLKTTNFKDLLLFQILTLYLLASVNTYTPRNRQDSAASESQIRNAIENKYDDTGPGAKGREFAYHTYKTLENALVSYLDDPDTKLPDHEREKALRVLESQNSYRPKRPFPKTVEEYNAYTKTAPQSFVQLTVPSKPAVQIPASNYGFLKGLFHLFN